MDGEKPERKASAGELDQLAQMMFRTFSRLEYALKASGFHCGDGDANANWRKFSESLSGLFDQPRGETFKAAVAYVLAHPPKKQVIVDDHLDWRVVEPDTNLTSDRVLIYVRRVRNNLLHGGKFNGHWFEPERSEALLRHSLSILHACLAASPDVSAAFHD